MKLIVLGDSITKGTYTKIGDLSPNNVVEQPFSSLIKNFFNIDVVNYGINGISYSSTSSINSDSAITKTCYKTDVSDCVLICAGTNDYGTDVILGNKNDKTDVSFYGALDVVFNYFKINRPDSQLFVVMPLRRQLDGKNKAGFKLTEYRKAIKIKAKEYNIQCFNGYKVKIFPKRDKDRKQYIYDGLHLNQAGHDLYAKYLIKCLKKYIKNNKD